MNFSWRICRKRAHHKRPVEFRIKSLDDLKTRLAKVILIILTVETFKDAFGIRAQTPLDLLYVGATIALIGLALYLTNGADSQKDSEPANLPPSREGVKNDES